MKPEGGVQDAGGMGLDDALSPVQAERVVCRCGLRWRMMRSEDGRSQFVLAEDRAVDLQRILAEGLLRVMDAAAAQQADQDPEP